MALRKITINSECTGGRLVPLPLDREERWVMHSVLLDHVELASANGAAPADVRCELDVLEALENGDSAFTTTELDRIRLRIAAYARAFDSPDRDRAVARAIVDRLQSRHPMLPA